MRPHGLSCDNFHYEGSCDLVLTTQGVLPGVAHTLAMILKLVLMVAMVMLSCSEALHA